MSDSMVETVCRLARELQDANERAAVLEELLERNRERKLELAIIIRETRLALGGPEIPMALVDRAKLVVHERNEAVKNSDAAAKYMDKLFR